MKKQLTVSLLTSFFTVCTLGVSAQRIKVGPTEETELISVIMHLSGAVEYNQSSIWPEYRAVVDAWFERQSDHPATKNTRDERGMIDSVVCKWSSHPAIRIFRDLRQDTWWVLAARPLEIALNGYFKTGRFHSEHFPDKYNLPKERHDEFIAAISDFYRETNFHKFYTKKALPLYLPTMQRWEAEYNALIDPDWVDGFTGLKSMPAQCFVPMSYLLGPLNIGTTLYDGTPRPTMGIDAIERENPRHEDLLILLHEYLHPILDPYVVKYKEEFAPSGEIIFPPVRKKVASYYNTWTTVLRESLIDAAVGVYLRERGLPESAREWIDWEKSDGGVWWIERLVEKLEEYQKQRDKYPAFESFMPEIVEFYNALAKETLGS